MSSTGVIADPVTEVLDQWSAVLDEALSMPFAQLQATGQVDAYARYEELRRRTEYLGLKFVQALEASGAAKTAGAPTVSALLRYRMRLSAAEANARVKAAKALCESHSMTGESIPAQLPQAARAAESGEVSQAHVGAIIQTINDLPQDAEPGLRDFVEETLVDYARQKDPIEVKRFGHELALRLNPKDPDPEKVATRRGPGVS